MTIRNADRATFRQIADALARLLREPTGGARDAVAHEMLMDVARRCPAPS